MQAPSCPYHIECCFYNVREKTSADRIMTELFCFAHHPLCFIAGRLRERKPVPGGTCPDGNVKG